MGEGSDRSVLVTGTSSGIGAAIVERLADEGWQVFAGLHSADEAAEPDSAVVTRLHLDVTSSDSIAAAAAMIGERTGGRLDALVNNAGIPAAGPVETVPIDDVRSVLETNLIGQFAVTQAFLPMIRTTSGRVVFISSMGGRVAFPYASPYHASKFGLEGLAESLRAEMAPLDVAVTLVEPSAMATEIWGKGRERLAASRERMSDEQRAVYGEALAGFDERLASAEDSEDPAEVADKVLKALTADSPEERYVVGRGARTLTVLRPLIPDAIFDRISQRVLGPGGT